MGRPRGFEPPTSGTTNRRSNQLSYDRHTPCPSGRTASGKGASLSHSRLRLQSENYAVLSLMTEPHPALDRLRSEAALAALCGASPLEASSGKTTRHRLNRGGDRAANNALWTISMVRMRSDPRTRAYVARRTAEGLSTKEIQRCLKRYIVRELYPLILADLAESIRKT